MLSRASVRKFPRAMAALFAIAAKATGYLILTAVITITTACAFSMSRFHVHTLGIVVVTGASSGIGEDAVAELVASTNLTVYGGVRSIEDKQRLERAYPGLRAILLDVTKPEMITEAVRLIADTNLPVVGLVNNAGVQADLPIELQTSAADRFTYDVNVFGLLDVTRAFLPLLRQTGNGARIVNVGSLAGVVAAAGSATYSSAKFAVEGLTDSLRREVAPFGIAVALLQPGYVRSRMGAKLHATSEQRYGVSASQYALYHAVFEGFFADDRRLSMPENAAPPTTTTTPAILDALLTPTPRTRYPVATVDGIPTWLIIWLQNTLPDRVMDLLV